MTDPDDIKQLARYQAIKKADQIREEAIHKTSKGKEIKRTEKRAIDDIEQSARYQTIRNAALAREQAIVELRKRQNSRLKSTHRSKLVSNKLILEVILGH